MNSKQRKLDAWIIISLAALLLFTVFLLYPLFGILRQSVVDAKTGAVSVNNFAEFFSKKYYYGSLLNSFKVTSSEPCSRSSCEPFGYAAFPRSTCSSRFQ